eukprot:gene2405-3248_t
MFLLLFIIALFHFFFLNPIRGFKYNNHLVPGILTPRMTAPNIVDFLAGFDSFTKSIGNLGATAPLAVGVFWSMQEDNKFVAALNASSKLFQQDIKATSDLRLKDIKANSVEMKATRDLLLKDIKSLIAFISTLFAL